MIDVEAVNGSVKQCDSCRSAAALTESPRARQCLQDPFHQRRAERPDHCRQGGYQHQATQFQESQSISHDQKQKHLKYR